VAFGTLTDGLVSTFHHELFHNLQWNISLHSGGDGTVDGAESAWQFFSEGTAVLAESVGQPRGQFTQTYPPITYMSYANGLVGRSRTPGLDLSYTETDPYQAAIYWRFLYEQCGGKQGGNPAAGMQVIRRALVTLYAGQVVDIRSSTDLVGALPKVMDQALAGSSCPFQTYQDSLTAFARALYELRLDGGRCTESGTPDGCGLYDPHDQYKEPSISTIAYTGTNQEYRDGISNSFGIDLIDVSLDPAADGRALPTNAPLTLEFHGAAASGAEFDVQVLCLADSGQGAKPRRVACEAGGAEVLMRASPDGHLVYVIPASRTAGYNRLGLIITRLDTRESSDPVGEYTLVLHTGI
jgi:hypothetical protein